MKGKVAIVIPFYQSFLSDYDLISLKQCENLLAAYPKIAIKPHSLTLPVTANENTFTEVMSFSNHFFSGIAGYNHLMLSPEFYARFLEYEYILIYQLDAFVFKDDLSYWCDQGIDYIGAPWIRSSDSHNPFKWLTLVVQQQVSVKFNLKKNDVPNKYQFENRIGNGGLSLRRVNKFYEVASSQNDLIQYYLFRQTTRYNEDAFWSIEVNRKKKVLNIPSWKTGLKFAFEIHPERAYKLNNYDLPFGCHDWDRYADFWRPIFKSYNFCI